MIKYTTAFICLLMTFPSLISVTQARSVENNICVVTLKIDQKRQDIILGKGGNHPKTHSLILKPEEKIHTNKPCEAYVQSNEFHMNNVQQHDAVFQSLNEGDVIRGSLNFHLPSPHGKALHENYHHGFRLLKIKRSGDNAFSEEYLDKYIYFRHIGLY